MKIRTCEMLLDKLSEELVWRKKELAIFKAFIEAKDLGKPKHHALLRAGTVLLYAHWEGFVKASAEHYLEFVSFQRLKHKDLASNFLAMCIKKELGEMEQSNKIIDQMKIIDFFFNKLSERSALPYRNMVSTKNLSSTVFQNIVLALGLDYSVFQTKEVLIDEKLSLSRHSIAHGEDFLISADDYFDLHEKVIEMMEDFRTQIDNSASMKAYKRVYLGE